MDRDPRRVGASRHGRRAVARAIHDQFGHLGDRVPLTGLAANQHGLALWNAAAGAAETARDGHSTPWTTCSTAAPYYLATRDHSTIDVGSTAGFRGAPVIEGLPEFLSALTVNGFATTDLTIGWTPQTLGDDVEGDDWLFDQTSGVETRYYTGGQMTVQLRGEPLASGPMPTTTLTTSYNVLSDCADDTVTLSTGVLLLANSATTSSAPVQAVAAALVSDLADNGLRLVSDALVSTGPTIGASGRTGAFLEAATGRLEVDAPCSCDIGIHDTDLTHDWTLMWPEAALPTNGALQLKVVAVTPALASATPGPGRITVTIFDDSAPTRGLVLDVPFPTAKGEASAMVALTIQPQTEYRFTVSHSGGSGRYYRLGMSHAALRLGQADQRYLTGRSQDWAVNAGAGETVTLELSPQPPRLPHRFIRASVNLYSNVSCWLLTTDVAHQSSDQEGDEGDTSHPATPTWKWFHSLVAGGRRRDRPVRAAGPGSPQRSPVRWGGGAVHAADVLGADPGPPPRTPARWGGGHDGAVCGPHDPTHPHHPTDWAAIADRT